MVLEKRVKCLIYIKTEKFRTRQDLADALFIHVRTMERWLNNYKKGSTALMLTIKPKNKGSKIITIDLGT